MFSLRFRKAPPDDLLNSTLLDERTFYRNFIHDLNWCQRQVIIESPYMTLGRVNMFAPILRKLVNKGVSVRVNTRFPGHHDQLLRIQGYTAARELRRLGVEVRYFHDYHHRKIAVLDERILYEGSLNILSQSRSREVMRRIESESLSKQMIHFLGLNRFHW